MIAIAAVIGTVMKQGEATSNYINQFGPFWFEVFRKLGLYAVYSAWWFLLLMGVLVLSTTLCIVRNAPKMLRDMRSWRENVREQSLLNFHHKMQWRAPLARAALAQQSAARLVDAGYQSSWSKRTTARWWRPSRAPATSSATSSRTRPSW
jgi:cytochrome c biogenesis protein